MAPVAGFAWRPRAIAAHPSRGPWPHRELNRRPQWQGSHGGLGPFRHTAHEDRGPHRELHRRPQRQ
eukprot:6732-Pyramimonas_sp.AAC.1